MMRSLDLLLVPSTAEGLPTVALEAMARGVPVLATPAGGTGELVKHERTGFLLERDRWEAFLRDADWKEVAEVGERGRRYVRQHFSLSRMTREFEFVAMEAARRARR
jgi:glycosyltransferase involved in cell wall biosynthesis